MIKDKLIYNLYGLKTIGGKNGHKLCISFVGKCVDGWKDFYENKPPWKYWYSNPVFCNLSGYDDMLMRYRVHFCIMWFSVRY